MPATTVPAQRTTASPTSPRRRLAAALLAAAAVPVVLTGCATGFNAYTSQQGQSGNGVFATTGAVAVQNATIVRGPEGDRSATLTAQFYNSGPDLDALVGATIVDPSPQSSSITGQRLPLPPNRDVRVGFESLAHVNFYGVDLKPGSYVTVTLQFERAGQISTQMLVVPPEGIYEGIRPVPARPLLGGAEASPQASPSA